ncbi:outer membrane homotrimeric porin [Desulfohalobiaceae bacterium Ax17]|jgi:hypothetical protein|uniref:outer membrane homotrimeric porin n=1 Tax=Desulfovulcanus ferrireducens TaxID=2831190 RepID=UPI00207B9EF8|nr:outer membrane homotrimeric porin [Desulfovulcanus ferrireducens]MBT8762715.1 outer membrane homotrimeric porin [Desulfovulcanus ferrireducens]
MKRFALLALIAAFILGTVATASAVDIKAKGSWRVVGLWSDNKDFTNQDGEDDFMAKQRARTTFEFVASENLKAVAQFQFIDGKWGDSGVQVGDTFTTVTRQLYLSFNLPETAINIKAGYQGIATPSAVGYYAPLDSRVGGVVVNGPVNDMVGLTVGWFRAKDLNASETTDYSSQDEVDLLYAALPVNADALSVTPWALYAIMGDDTGTTGSMTVTKDASAYWLGVAVKADMFDPIVVAADLIYGDFNDDLAANDQAGWAFAVAVDYKMDTMTPEVFFAYATGNDDDATDGSETIPNIASDAYLTTMYFDASSLGAGIANTDVAGLWALGLKLKGLSFVDGVTHNFSIMYAKGTTDKNYLNTTGADQATLTEKDSLVEVTLNSKYMIYEQLAAIVELGYAKANYDENLGTRGNDYKDEAAWSLAVGLKYDF